MTLRAGRRAAAAAIGSAGLIEAVAVLRAMIVADATPPTVRLEAIRFLFEKTLGINPLCSDDDRAALASLWAGPQPEPGTRFVDLIQPEQPTESPPK